MAIVVISTSVTATTDAIVVASWLEEASSASAEPFTSKGSWRSWGLLMTPWSLLCKGPLLQLGLLY